MQKSFKNTRPVSDLSYPTSDIESDAWVEPTIKSEIVRGRELQEQKSISERSRSLFSKFPKPVNDGIRERRKAPKWNKRLRAKSPIPKNARMSALTSHESSVRSYRSPRIDRPACSMRITELAVPTKRQCIASWRANSNILPENMINRLKERVTDQVPIVKVSDAVNCMKHDKRSSHSQNKVIIASVKRPPRKINKEAMNNKIQAENENLSNAFGRKIAQLLMRPMAITLNSELQNISNIISEEINNVIKDNKTFRTDRATNKVMVREISEKVTIWIGKILEDSKEKLLEEELRVVKALRRFHRPMIGIRWPVTLLGVTTHVESELEEQEGPVLDVLDDIIDIILHKCISTPSGTVTPEYVSICSSDNDKDEAHRHLTHENTSQAHETSEVSGIKVNDEDTIENDMKNQSSDVIDSMKHDNTEMSEDTIENDIKKQINEVINSLKHNDSETSITEHGDSIQSETYQSVNDEKHKQADDNLDPDVNVLYSKDSQLDPETPGEQNYDGQDISANKDIGNVPDLNVPDEKENNIPSEIENNLTPLPAVDKVIDYPVSQIQNPDDGTPLETDEIKIIDDFAENEIDTNEEQTSNVSDAIEIITDGLSEEQNKKVQFSRENLGPMIDKGEYYLKNSTENLHQEHNQLLDTTTNQERPSIDFAPPNDHLLSDADESWPDEAPVTKPSASITRSITSMGRIVETDEKLSIALDDTNHFPENTNPFQGSVEYHEDNDGLKEVKNEEQQEVSYLQKKGEDLGYINEIDNNKIVLQELDEAHSSKLVIEVMKTDGSSVIVQDAPELPTSRESEKIKIHVAEVKQNVSDENMQKEVSVEDFQNKVGPAAIDSTPPPFVAMLSKLQNYDSFVSLKKSHAHVSKSDDYANDDTVYGQIYQMHAISEGITSRNFDYRVNPKTAPAWIRRGQGDPSGGPCACSGFHHPATIKMKDREREILKWDRDLDFVLLKLDKWKQRLNYISKYITTLKHKAALYNVGKNSVACKHKQSAGIDNASWRMLNQRAKGGLGLELRKRNSTVKFKISPPLKYCTTCGRTKPNCIKKQRNRNHSRNFVDTKCMRHIQPECLIRTDEQT